MILYNQLWLLLLTCFGIKSERFSQYSVPSDYFYKVPSNLFSYQTLNPLYTYLYYPQENRYEIVNYRNPVHFEKLKSPPKDEVKKVKSSDKSVSSVAEGGKKYKESFHKKQGHKSNEKYSKDQKYSKGKKGSFEKHDEKDESSKKESESLKHNDHKAFEEESDSNEENNKGEKYNSRKHHNKGSKSIGYHNIFMKDEYKKDHIFYDNSDESGQYSKHGMEHKKYHKNDQELSKSTHEDSGSKSDAKKKHGSKHKKEYEKADEGYKKDYKKKSHGHIIHQNVSKDGKANYNVAIKHAV